MAMDYNAMKAYIDSAKSLEDQYGSAEGWIDDPTGMSGLNPMFNKNNYGYKTYNVPGIGTVQYDPRTGSINRFDGGQYRPGSSGQAYTSTDKNNVATDGATYQSSNWLDKIPLDKIVPTMIALGTGGIAAGASGMIPSLPTMAGAVGSAPTTLAASEGLAALPVGGMAETGTLGTAPWAATSKLGTGLADIAGAAGGAGGASSLIAPSVTSGANSFSKLLGPALSTGLSAVGGYLGERASNDAANAQTSAAERAIAEQRRQYDQTRSDLTPYRNTGYGARNKIALMMGIDPGLSTGQAQQDPLWNTGYRKTPTYEPAYNRNGNGLMPYLKNGVK